MRKTIAWGALIAMAGLTAIATPAHAASGYQFPLPTINLAKSANVQSYSGAGIPITYTYDVTNDGDVSLTSVTVTDPMPGLSAIDCGGGTNVIAEMDPGDTQDCTATYTTSQNDVTAGSITNTGSVTGTVAGGSTVSYNSSLTIPETQAPINCVKTSEYFDSEAPAGGPETLYYNTSPGGSYNHFSPPYSGTYNAIGFNYTGSYTGYIYALSKIGNRIKLLKIGGAGALMPGYPKNISGYPTGALQPVIGAFDPSGNYWVAQRVSASSPATTAYVINASAASPSVADTYTLSPGFKAADWTYDQGYLWGLVGNKIYRAGPVTPLPANLSTIPVSVFTATVGANPPFSAGVYGGAWTYANGNLGFSNNASGKVFQVKITGPPSTPALAEVPPPFSGPQSSTQLNDGTACLGSNADLGLIDSGPSTVQPGSPISWNLTVTDDGPGDSSGFVLDDTTTSGITGLTTSTPGCTVIKGNIVDCAENSLDNGDSYTVTLSGTAPTAAGKCVTTTATVTGNEADPDSGNNTASEQTCTTSGSKGTWTVQPGGKFSGKSGTVNITDTSTGTVITCKTSALTGTLQTGSGLTGTGLGSVTGLSLSGCAGPAGLAFTETSNALPWALNAASYTGGVTSGMITGIDATLTSSGCSATLDGTAAGADNGQVGITYSNSSGQLAVLATGGNLTFSAISGCLGLISNGDAATASATYTLSPKQKITSP